MLPIILICLIEFAYADENIRGASTPSPSKGNPLQFDNVPMIIVLILIGFAFIIIGIVIGLALNGTKRRRTTSKLEKYLHQCIINF